VDASCQPHAPATLPLAKEYLVPTEMEVGWPQNQSGQFKKKKPVSSLPLGLEPQTVQPAA
jgi:hypothetical protein